MAEISKVAESTVQVSDNGQLSTGERLNKTRWTLLWDSFDKPPKERKFLLKLDTFLLTISCLGYFIKYLDQTNIFNAYVSGLRKDIGLRGNDLSYAVTTWTAGYIAGQVPSNIVITRVRPSIWIPTLQVLWSIVTMLTTKCSTAGQLFAVRFFIGLLEAGLYPGIIYILGSWYRWDEIGKRTALFAVSGSVASMFSGYLMAGLLSMDGKGGLSGWQWLFIMDGVISLPIAFAGFFVYPDFPDDVNPRAKWWITEEDRAIARARTADRPKKQPYTKAKFAKIFTGWHIYLLPLVFLFGGAAAAGTAAPIFALYLQSTGKYTLAQINNIPTATSGVAVASQLIYAWISDGFLRGRRWPILLWIVVWNFICFTSLAIWDIPRGWRWFCYIFSGQVDAISPMSLAWGNEIVNDDEEERSIVVAAMADSAFFVGIWLILIIWQTKDEPRYQKGFITASVFSGLAVVLIFLVRYLHKRDLRRKQSAPRTEAAPGETEAPEKV